MNLWRAAAGLPSGLTAGLTAGLLAGLPAGLLAGVLTAGMPAHAHHSYGFNYDGNTLLTLSGTVRVFSIENPHSRIVVDTRNAQGRPETWTVETVPASRTAQIHHPLQSVVLNPGDAVTVMGWPAKDGSKRIGGHKVILPDRREIMLRPSITLPPLQVEPRIESGPSLKSGS